MKMNDEQNRAYMNDPRRVAAQKEVDDLTRHISADVKSDGSAEYYLTVLPPMLKRLEQAAESLSVIEATVAAEILGQNRYHG